MAMCFGSVAVLGLRRAHCSVVLRPRGAGGTAVSAVPVMCTALPSSASFPTSPWLSPSFSSPLSCGHGFQYCSLVLKKDNFEDHYRVITVISFNYLSIHTSCWKDAHRAPCSAASVTPAGRLQPTQARVPTRAHLLH